MVNVTFVEYSGTAHEVKADVDDSLMQVATRQGIPGIVAECGGSLSCGTCHVYIRAEWFETVGPPGEMESGMLEMAVDPSTTSRLSCCVKIRPELDGLFVDIPQSQS